MIIKAKDLNKISNDIATLVESKDKDYNRSFDKSLDKYGDIVYLIRLGDKINRLENIIMNKGYKIQVSDEKLEDTVKDIIGYSLLFLRRLEGKNEL